MRISDWSSDVCSSDLLFGGDGAVTAMMVRLGDIYLEFFFYRQREKALGLAQDFGDARRADGVSLDVEKAPLAARSEEHTSELQSLMRNSYAVCCLKKNKNPTVTVATISSMTIPHVKTTNTNDQYI